jgi:2-oxoisovalerate dehydrogenase E1 component
VDGNDVLAVQEAAGEAVRRARTGGGPTLLECKTYRTRPHAEGMGDFTYRSREEVETWKRQDPILRLRDRLLAEGSVDEAELQAADAEITATVAEAQQFAESSPWPDPSTAAGHVYDEE